MRIAIAGVGKMGASIALRLRETGHDVHVWNRTAARLAPLVEAGCTAAPSPKALADASDVVLTILTDRPAQDAIYDGPQGLLAGNLAGKLVLDMSTVRPEDSIALAAKVRAAGAAFVECPVGGTTGPARQGKLLGLAGGDAADIARARPLLDQLCRRVEHVGPVGAGASLKLAVNLPLIVYFQALGESVALCRHLGHDPAWLMELLGDTSGAAAVMKTRAPAFAAALGGKLDAPPAFDVDSICKDLRTMVAEAKARGTDLPVAARTLEVFETARREGWGGKDGSTLPAYWGRKG
jgi:3-hydroxyisobutyrate dehydrogenase